MGETGLEEVKFLQIFLTFFDGNLLNPVRPIDISDFYQNKKMLDFYIKVVYHNNRQQ